MSTTSNRRQLDRESCTVALICPREIVLSAVRFMLDEEHDGLTKVKRDPLYYVLGSMNGHNVVLASLPGVSRSDIATAGIAAHLLHTFPAAELRLLVSIGGGVPSASHDIRLGDVVFSDPNLGAVTTYDFEKETKLAFKRRVGYIHPTPAPLVEACMNMKHDHRAHPNRIADIMSRTVRRYPGMNTFCRPSSPVNSVLHALDEHSDCGNNYVGYNGGKAVSRHSRLPNQSNIQHGTIASSTREVTDRKNLDELAEEFNVICLDTAASGLQCFPGLVICGIYHYCDSKYNDTWSPYAAAVAAACAKHILSFIPPIDIESAIASRIKRRKTGRHPPPVEGTCWWVTAHPSFEEWNDGKGTGLFWVSSDPWTGKSVISRHLIDQIIPKSPARTVCYYFFSISYEPAPLSRAIYCLLHQLFKQRPELLLKPVLEAPESHVDSQFIPLGDLFELLIATAQQHKDEIILVLDGIDQIGWIEREELVNKLVDFFDQQLAPNLKVLVTSRPCSTTQRILQVLENKVTRLGSRRSLHEQEERFLFTQLTSFDNRVYLWAKHFLDEIEGGVTITTNSMCATLASLPNTVEQEYADSLKWCADYGPAKTIFQIVVAARRPFLLEELAAAMDALDENVHIEPIPRFRYTIREMCGLLITVMDDHIHFVHSTVRDFLIKPGNDLDPWCGAWNRSVWPGDAHRILAEACVKYLHRTYTDIHWEKWNDLVSMAHNYPFLQYAVQNWHYDIVHMLLNSSYRERQSIFTRMFKKLHIDVPDARGRTPIWYAARGGHEAVIKRLLETGNVNPDRKDADSVTPLACAAANGHMGAARLLVDTAKVNLYSRDTFGETPLMCAMCNGHNEIVRILIAAGAMPADSIPKSSTVGQVASGIYDNKPPLLDSKLAGLEHGEDDIMIVEDDDDLGSKLPPRHDTTSRPVEEYNQTPFDIAVNRHRAQS
ncbi:hypothetical protein BJX63DRAFT_430066 [Aspergillus granulosus]|uniref:Uncharacterized protein n=1 Tax=Aspergillus granulosus TaxID=176169 RepID=A0ABR4HMG4_9EURO